MEENLKPKDMTSIFYAIGNGSEAFFKLMPALLQPVDLFFMITGTIMTVLWIRHLLKNKDVKGFNPTTEELNVHH